VSIEEEMWISASNED